jgi:hypothetical protein
MSGQFDAAVGEGETLLRTAPQDGAVAAELSRGYAAGLRFEEAASALEEARRRAGISGPSALLDRLRAAAAKLIEARAMADRGESAGFDAMAKLAAEWGNDRRAMELQIEADGALIRESGTELD